MTVSKQVFGKETTAEGSACVSRSGFHFDEHCQIIRRRIAELFT